MHTVKSIGVISVAKMMGAIYAVLGLIFIPIFLLAGMAGMMTGQKEAAVGAGLMLVLALIFPILYGAIGFVAGAITALLYNLFAGWVGGIELKLQAPVVPQAPYAAATVMPPTV
jgi:hypothetical protein